MVDGTSSDGRTFAGDLVKVLTGDLNGIFTGVLTGVVASTPFLIGPFFVGVLLGMTFSSFRVEVVSFFEVEGIIGVAAFEVFPFVNVPFDSETERVDDFLGVLASTLPFVEDVDLVELLLEVSLLFEVLLLAVDEDSSLS